MNSMERTRDPRLAACIAALKVRIKELASAQREERVAVKALQRAGGDASSGQAELFVRSARITASLNVYLELRGRSYRHGIPENAQWLCAALHKDVLQWVEELRRV